MSEFKIDKNVPVPEIRHRSTKYPWFDMKVGDSFFVPGRKSNALSAAWGRAVKQTGWRFTSRSVDGGTRVWRIE